MKQNGFHTPLALTAGVLIVLMALLAAGSLLLLFHLYTRFVQSAAADSALQYGTLLSGRLAGADFMAAPPDAGANTEAFRRLAESLHGIDPRLEYVTVQEDDLVLFHWQAPLTGTVARAAGAAPPGDVVVSPRLLRLGARTEPVLDFTRMLPDGARRLRIGLRREILERERGELLASLRVMFRVALGTVAAAFCVCLLAVLALVWREMRWLSRRGREEHLAFAGAVAGAVIHDFRNPMSALRLDAQLLAHEVGPGGGARAAKIGELAGRVETTLGRMDEILREFLELSSPDRPAPGLFDVNAAVADCVDLLRMRFERAGVALASDLAPRSLTVRGFPVQFKRALLNVMNNALQFAPAGTGVTIRVLRHARHVEIVVADEGPGIPAADRRRVFDMFFSRRPGGTGMGLALARTAVLNCGGRIMVEDAPGGRGCLVRIRLPLVGLI